MFHAKISYDLPVHNCHVVVVDAWCKPTHQSDHLLSTDSLHLCSVPWVWSCCRRCEVFNYL